MFHAFGEDGPMIKGGNDNNEFQDIARKFYDPMFRDVGNDNKGERA
jgi:hypothetical protein